MNSSNPRDVQDLIAEFVSSKNQLLHEEIISSIKKESFTNKYTEETVEAEIGTPLPEPVTVAQTAGNQQALQQKIDELTARNNELQAELTMMQMQESQTIASTKPIGADDLRMEFLNFTSAHIQQFNTRIKRTEELIESQIQKNQQPSENKNRKEFPQWLYWTNLAALALIAVYCLFSMFRSDPGQHTAPTAKTTEAANTSQKAAVSAEKKHEEAPAPQAAPEVPASTTTFSATASNTESASTPFHKTTEIAAAATANTPVTNAQPIPVTSGVKAVNQQIAVKPVVATASRPITRSSGTPAPVRSKNENKTEGSAVRPPVKQPLAVSSKPVKTEKKAAPQEKVYFGED
ncbi:MAG: hypothetical protein IT257_11825 [Chitinophagaceae bacterium]|nr:hypothetical protein [Chitinophagaceae bacterium]